MKIKRIIAYVVLLTLCLGVLGGCKQNKTKCGKYSIVCTIFPEYDWVKEILGDKISDYDVTLLLDKGVDLHNYQPTAADIAKIASCDLFIYVGGESDEWVEDVLKESVNKDMKVINLLDILGEQAKVEEMKEGMEDSHEEEEDEEEFDEHVWLSLNNAKLFCNEIGKVLIELEPEIKGNLEDYIKKLDELDSKYKKAVDDADIKTIIFADRFPFRYLVDDYGIDYYAAFVGCAAETKASFATVTFLAGKVDSLGISNVLVTESSDKSIAQSVISGSKKKNQKILVLDSMQSTTSKNISSGTTYISVMEKNLEVLIKAMN